MASAVKTISEFLKDDPNPPKTSELMAFFKSVDKEEKYKMALSIDPDYESK